MKIGFTYDLRSIQRPDENSPADYYGEFETEATIEFIEKALTELGHDVTKIGNIQSLLQFLANGNMVDLVFNMAEGRQGRAREAQVPGVLEAYNIAYTFSDAFSLTICLDKALTKQLLRAANIPTPNYLVLPMGKPIDAVVTSRLGWPIFLKPVAEGTSKGIDDKAIVHTQAALSERVTWLWETYQQPVLAESYLPGREFTVGLLGTGDDAYVLGIAEITLSEQSKVYGFVEKEECETLVSYSALQNDQLVDEISQIALDSYRLLECRDAGRVDICLDQFGVPQVLEINTLPGMHPFHSDLPIIATHVGMSYNQLIDEIIKNAAKRIK